MNTIVPKADGTYEIHISDINSFKGCRQQWHYSSHLQRNLEPARPYVPFFFGRMVHHALERWYAGAASFEDSIGSFLAAEVTKISSYAAIWEEEGRMFAEQSDLALAMLRHRRLWEDRMSGANKHTLTYPFALSNLEFISLEQSFKVPVRNPATGRVSKKIFFAGKLDGIVRRRDTGDLWIWEEKTARSVEQRIRMLDNDPQATAYLWALRQVFGDSVKGVIYTIMGKRVPSPVKVVRGDVLSSDTRNQTYDSYLAAIKTHHNNPEPGFIRDVYGDALMELHMSDNTYFKRVAIARSAHAIERAADNIYWVGREMIKPGVAIFPTEGLQCNYCIFKEPCVAEQNGGDSEDILAAGFRDRTGYIEEEVAVEA